MKTIQTDMAGRILVLLAMFVIIITGIKIASVIVVPFLLSLFIAIISSPALFWLKDRGLSSGLATIVVICLIIAGGILILRLIGTSLEQFSDNVAVYREKLNLLSLEIVKYTERYNLDFSIRGLSKYVNPGDVFTLTGTLLNSFGSLLSNIFLILLTVIFMLLEASDFPDKLRRMVRNPEDTVRRFGSIADNVKHYLAIKTLTSVITAALVTLGLMLLNVDFPYLWGFLAFFLNFVPNIGSIIAAVPAILIALIDQGTGTAFWTAFLYLAINNLVGNFLEPKLLGHRLGLSTLVIFISLIFWGWVLGPVGMFLSVPLTMTAKIIVENHPNSNWLAVLMGPPGEDDSVTETADNDKKVV